MIVNNFKKRVNICFGVNDVRCIADKELDGEIAYRTGKAVVELLKCKKFIVGHDMRISSHKLRDAFINGIKDYGCDVIDIGAIDSPGLYFASGSLNFPGGMITASHNPAKYNGIKLTKAGAIPIGKHTGLNDLKKIVEENKFKIIKKRGKIRKKNIFPGYRNHVHSFIKLSNINKIKIVIDAGNGMAGRVVPKIYKGLKVKIFPLDFKLDGRFPTHEANPAKPENIMHLRKEVLKKKVDFGIAFDGDMDRVFFVDELGNAVDSSHIAAFLIKYLQTKEKKINVVYNTVMSKIVPEVAEEYNGRAHKEKVGHTNIKTRMRKTKSIFGAEHSAHYYYKDNWYADSGIITSLIICEIFSKAKHSGLKFSDLLKVFKGYSKMPEKSIKVKNKDKIIKLVENKYKKFAKKIEKFDGLTLEFDWGWFNIRPSNTEPLLRINLEAYTKKLYSEESKKLLKFLKRNS